MFSGSMSMDVIVDEGGEIAPHLHWHCIYGFGEHFTRSHVRERSREASVQLKCFQTGIILCWQLLF